MTSYFQDSDQDFISRKNVLPPVESKRNVFPAAMQ